MVESCPRYFARSSANSVPAIARGKKQSSRANFISYARSVTAEGSAQLDLKLGYVVFRLSLRINLLIHGAGRFLGPGVEAFFSKTTIAFAGTPPPAGLVHAFLTVLSFAEFILGGLDHIGPVHTLGLNARVF
jgi:hypothetical protein